MFMLRLVMLCFIALCLIIYVYVTACDIMLYCDVVLCSVWSRSYKVDLWCYDMLCILHYTMICPVYTLPMLSCAVLCYFTRVVL